jgi:hypothetical protein
MSTWVPEPKLDDNAKVGLSFISIGYGVVLVAVFPTASPATIGVAEWFHLGLAAFMLVVSYMGYYSNRQQYAEWCIRFFNIPLFQYVLSFGILFLYWELGVALPKSGSKGALRPEAMIIFIIFAAYLVWDFLEVAVQESDKYIRIVIAQNQPDKLPVPPLRSDYRQRWNSAIWTLIPWPGRTNERFAKDVRARRAMTFVFALIYLAAMLIIRRYRWEGTAQVAVGDSAFILSFFVYRYLQWAWSKIWYHRVQRHGEGENSGSADC